MATVEATLRLFDNFSSTMMNATRAMNSTARAARRLQSVLNATYGSESLTSAVAATEQVAANSQRALESQRNLVNATNRNNERLAQSRRHTQGMSSDIDKMLIAYLAFAAAQKAVEASDNYVNAQARLRIINNGQDPAALQAQVFEAANRSRGDYVTMADAVAKLGLLAGDAFTGNSEVLKFSELMQKSFKVSGASTQESQAGMYQLTQAMASGKLQGDEFRSIMENAPMLADAIAKFTGKSKGQLKDMSADGTITADIIKNALFTAADDINKKFATMPMTFGDAMTLMKNEIFQNFGPVIERMNRMLNSDNGKKFFEGMSNTISVAAGLANKLLTIIGAAINFMMNNSNIVVGALVALGVAFSIMGVQAMIAWIEATWPILLIAAAIGGLIALIMSWGVTFGQIIGFIAGLFTFLGGVVWNTIALMWNIIVDFVEFFVNVWVDPVYAGQKLFYDLAQTFGDVMVNMLRGIESFSGGFMKFFTMAINAGIKGLNALAELSNKILNTDIKPAKLFDEENVHSVSDALDSVFKSMNAPTTNKAVKDLSGMKMKPMDLANATMGAFNAGESLFNGLKLPDLKGAFGFDGTGEIKKVGEVGKIGDTVDISNEDLKAMRELAEMKSIQNFVTLTPTVQVTGDNHYHQQGSVEDMAGMLAVALETHMNSSMDGVIDDGL
ncbi:tape measure protein [Paenibacillus anseongense]|uniref:tape measure protein n=1 Tax=Paenibacillus anseongense TaxID=2682845 RepID=UPI002DB93A71|nr:tape measure protein [Paenibacillus anseongense]MEC0269415.1 tape measure protein [Paenibacillus anseongense]